MRLDHTRLSGFIRSGHCVHCTSTDGKNRPDRRRLRHLVFGLVYQLLFLSYAEEGTPGMRYARIALCTFEDENPTIEQMRMRIPAMLFAALPAGLGLLWAIFDSDHLGLARPVDENLPTQILGTVRNQNTEGRALCPAFSVFCGSRSRLPALRPQCGNASSQNARGVIFRQHFQRIALQRAHLDHAIQIHAAPEAPGSRHSSR